MKILHVVAGLAKTGGGTSEVVPRLCEALVAEGHEVHLRTVELGELSDATVRASTAGVDFRVFPRTRFIPPALSFSRAFWKDVRREVAWADVVHLHGLWESPCWLAGYEAMRAKKPFVMMPHGFLEPERLKKSRRKKDLLGRLVERPLLKRAARVIATAESEADGIRQYGVSTPIEVVPIGIETDEIDVAERDEELLGRLTEGRNAGRRILLYFSRIAPIKGLDMLVDAWVGLASFHKDWHLLIVGPDTQGYTEILQNLVALKVKDGSVTIHGPVYGDEKFRLLKSADLFVLPTRSENFSIAVQEALAAGVPVVCTKGAPWSGLQGQNGAWGQCGYWVDISVEGIRRGLESAMSFKPEQWVDFSSNARKFIKSEFVWDKIATRMCSIYESMLKR